MKKFLTTLLFILTIATAMFFGSPTVAFAQEGQVQPPRVVASNGETTAQNSAYINVSAQNFVDVGGLEVFIFYDANLFEINSYWTGSLLNDAYSTFNVSESGKLALNTIALNGISGSNDLFSFYLYVKMGVPEGQYPITIAIGDAYSKTLEPISIETQKFYINVKKTAVQYDTVDIYSYQNLSQAKQGEIVEISYETWNGYNFASADFELSYDENLFKLKSIDLGYELKNATSAVYSVNDSIDGYVKVSYAALSGVYSAYPILTATFEVIQNVNKETEIEFLATEMYDVNLTPLNGKKLTNIINVVYQEPPKDLPDISISNHSGCSAEFSVDITADKKTGLAAGDFVVTYDATILEFKGATKVADNTMIVVNPNNTNGTIRFSFICQGGVLDDTIMARLTFVPKKVTSTSISVTGNNLVDADYNEVKVDYVSATITLKHDTILHEEQEPTCVDIGWYEYETCSRCDYTTYAKRPALGHRMSVPSVKITNDINYPFDIVNGVYSSTNKVDSSISVLTITALYDCSITVHYTVSSEQNFDQLIVVHNGNEIGNYSGEVYWSQMMLSLLTNDVVTISYSKDGSVATGTDTASFKLDYVVDKPAEEFDPTCEQDVICDYCDTLIKEKLGHDPIYHDGQQVTCLEKGWDAYETCSRCDHTTYVEIPALGHALTQHDAQEPTCIEIGWHAYEDCSRCDYTTYVERPALGHRVSAPAVAITNDATYPFDFADGVYSSTNKTDNTVSVFTITALYDCEITIDFAVSSEQNYDKLIIAKNGNEIGSYSGEVAWSQQTLSLLANEVLTISYRKDGNVANGTDTARFKLDYIVDKPAEEVEPTCTQDVVCSYCDTLIKEKLGHDPIYHDGQQVTCLEKGWDAYETCSRCDYTTYVEIPALGHDLTQHDAQEPTCTEIGRYAYEDCSRCDYTTYVERSALGHDIIQHTAQNPTCEEFGWDAYETCSRCNYSTYEQKPALGHDVIPHDAKAPTCTTIGWNAYDTCSRCDYSTYVEKAALGHNLTQHDAKDPTCLEIGWYAYETCGRCSHTTYVERPALGHNLTQHVAKQPTCKEIGWNAYEECDRCDHTTYTEVPALGHDVILHDAKAPTCTSKGWDAYETCSRCAHSTYAEKSALGHDVILHEAKVPTCTEIGWDSYETCSRCDYTTYAQIGMLGHDIQKHDAKLATCTQSGWYAYEDCSRCDYTTYLEMPVVDHNDTAGEEVAPTCTQPGWGWNETCAECGELLFVRIEALGHALTQHDAKDPTCTEIGWYAYEDCSRCNYTTYAERPALGHDIIQHTAQNPTCENVGWNAYETCSRCDYSTYAEKPALGHDVIPHDAKIPTCTSKGWDAYDTCSRCNYSTYAEKPALGHTLTQHDAKAPTCLEKGWYAYETCGRCNYTTYIERPALGHDMVNVPAQAPGCETVGWDAYKDCSRCDHSTKQEIPAVGHDYADGVVTEPTCTAQGYTTHTCTKCQYSYKDTYTPTVDHDYATDYLSDANGHWHKCKNCNATTTVENHSITNGSCSACGYQQSGSNDGGSLDNTPPNDTSDDDSGDNTAVVAVAVGGGAVAVGGGTGLFIFLRRRRRKII